MVELFRQFCKAAKMLSTKEDLWNAGGVLPHKFSNFAIVERECLDVVKAEGNSFLCQQGLCPSTPWAPLCTVHSVSSLGRFWKLSDATSFTFGPAVQNFGIKGTAQVVTPTLFSLFRSKNVGFEGTKMVHFCL